MNALFRLNGCSHALALAVLAGCSSVPPADTVFVGDNILTMTAAGDRAGFVAVRDGEIVALGARSKAQRHVGKATEWVSLGERALLPGFIDTHGHLTAVARLADAVNLAPPPVGGVRKIDDLVAALAEAPATKGWLIGYGYDDSLLAERRHPTRTDLDPISPDRPIALIHVSGHFATLNSSGLRRLGIDRSTIDAPGGVIRRDDAGDPNGVLEEKAIYRLWQSDALTMPLNQFAEGLHQAINTYLSFGITTIQDGATSAIDLDWLQQISNDRALAADVTVYPAIVGVSADAQLPDNTETSYTNGLRIAGAKITLDGSPQGRTAWLTEPYIEKPTGVTAGYRAYPVVPPPRYTTIATELIGAGVPLLVHANGDAAIDAALDGVEAAIEQHPDVDHRTVIIHAQLMRADQIERARQLGCVASFFAAHPFFWGDWHRRSFGEERAANISPLAWADAAGLPFTLHNDAPVVPPNMLRLLTIATERQTRSGHVLGPDQRISVERALLSVTRDAAYQIFEADSKGTLATGRVADFVVLSQDPTTTGLDGTEVVQTWVRGQQVYPAPER